MKAPKDSHIAFFLMALPGQDCTDFVVCETEDLKAYHFMWEEIRGHPVYTNGWMRIKNVVIGMEDAHQVYEQECLKQA